MKAYCDSDVVFVSSKWDDSSVQDLAGNLTRFEYDGNRRLVKRIRPVTRTGERNKSVLAEQVTRFFYNEADQLVREETDLLALTNGTNKGKLATELTYNLIDRVSRKVIKEEFMGDVTIKDDSNFTYSRQLDVTRLATANNQTVNLSFDYENVPPFSITNYSTASVDPANPLGLIQGNFSVTPDTTGEIGAISKDGSQLYSKSYDTAGRLVGVVSNFNSQSYAATIIRDALGRKTNVDNNGLLSVINYDVLNRITSLTYSGIDNFSQNITYNTLTGNIDQIIREIGTFNYTHDNLDQLTGVNFSGTPNLGPLVTNRTMDYDKAGNRIDDSFYGVTTNTRNTIKENDVWTYFTDRNGLGDIIQKSNENEAHLFEYRGDKRLSKYTHIQNNIETNNTTYYWDALGRRVAKETQAPTQTFTNVFAHEGDQDKILLSKNGNGDEYLNIDGQGIDEHLAQITPTEVKSYVTNHLGTVLNSEATDSTKATGAFGESLQSTPALTTSTNPVIYIFTGRQYDPESRTYYYRFRQYDAETSKFLAQDPIGFNGLDMNIGRYVFNNPLKYTDPTGLICELERSTGRLTCSTNGNQYLDVLVYSGGGSFGEGYNNPFLEGVKGIGPIPAGTFTIEREAPYTSYTGRRLSGRRLIPDPLTAERIRELGREPGSFLIHGASQLGPLAGPRQNASQGCPILNAQDRREIPAGEVLIVR